MTSINVRRLAATVASLTTRVVAEAKRTNATPDDLPSMRLPWYQIRAADDRGNPDAAADVFIFDEIGGSLGVSADQFVQELQAIDAPRINVRINSPGGAVMDAIAIHSALLHHPAKVRTYVDGWAASAASVIAMGADPLNDIEDTGGLVMMPGSQLMIHNASMHEAGQADDHRKVATFLDRQSDNIADMYARVGGHDREYWRALMSEETWMFANEAVGFGLADRVEDPHRPDPETEQLMSRSHDAYVTRYRYAGRRAAPAPGTVTSPQQKRTAVTAVHEREQEPPADRVQAALARRAAAPAQTRGDVVRDASAFALGTSERRLPFQAQLRSETVERGGKQFYRVEGYASVFNTPYPMWDEFGPYDEVVMPGAAARTLAANPHVVFLANHGGLALASTKNGTLELAADQTGLRDVAYLNPERQDVKDLVLAIKDETIEEQSFAFFIDEGVWNSDCTQFQIRSFDIHRGDVSAVNYGANPHTTIAARQREIFAELRRMSPAQARAAASVLSGRDVGGAKLEDLEAMIAAEVDARMNPPKATGTSLAHRWATLMPELSE